MAYTRILEFTSDDGVEVTVAILSPKERTSRVAAIESTIITACHLYLLHDRGGEQPSAR